MSATQEETGGLTQTLSQAEIDQLPDDPDELQRMLEEIAGPGAIDSRRRLHRRAPARRAIRFARIVVRRDAFSAEFHQVGQGRVEIATRPGVDRWRGNAGLNVRPSGLSAHNAVAQRAKAGTLMRMNAFVAGPLVKNRISFAAEVEGSSSEDTRGISALTLERAVRRGAPAAVRQPRGHGAHRGAAHARRRCSARRTSAAASERDNQGISELDLPERGYRREDVDHSSALLARRRTASAVSRAASSTISRRASSIPDTIAPAIIVQNAFRVGRRVGERRATASRSVVSDTMFTLKARPYTLRVGSLMTWNYNEQGQLRNTLGTFTFTDLDVVRGWSSGHLHAAGRRAAAGVLGGAGRDVHAGRVHDARALELRAGPALRMADAASTIARPSRRASA